MKRIILATVLMVAVLGAVEITVLGGGNYQRWDRSLPSMSDPNLMDIYEYDGFGFHAGGLVSVGLTRKDAPLFFGLETGANFTQFYYKTDNVDSFSTIDEGQLITLPRVPERYNFYSLTFPLLLKIVIQEGSWFRWGTGIGPAIAYTPSFTVDWPSYSTDNEFIDEYTVDSELNIGLEAKLEVAFRVWKLWIGPVFSMAYNITADGVASSPVDTRQYPSLSLETSYKF
jgi:hypothetical protein